MSSARVLSAEENPLNLKLVRAAQWNAGCGVIEARTGEEGVGRAQDSQPDVILMGLELPVINGTQALRLIRKEPGGGDVSVVALTAFAMAEDRDRALLGAFDGYLSKPISVRDLPHQV